MLRRVVLLAATGAGLGYAPVAPGTVGTLLALPFLPFLDRFRQFWPGAYILMIGLFAVGSMWVCGRAEELLGERDSRRIVLDEVIGLVVALAWLDLNLKRIAAGFAIFRLLDIVKPFPAGLFNRRGGGSAIVLDDLVAAAYTNFALRVARGWL